MAEEIKSSAYPNITTEEWRAFDRLHAEIDKCHNSAFMYMLADKFLAALNEERGRRLALEAAGGDSWKLPSPEFATTIADLMNAEKYRSAALLAISQVDLLWKELQALAHQA